MTRIGLARSDDPIWSMPARFRQRHILKAIETLGAAPWQ